MRKVYHVLDVLKFAQPHIQDIDVERTAAILKNQTEKGFLSYGSIYPRIKTIAEHKIDDIYLNSTFNFYKQEWKNRCLREVAKILSDYFAARGTWYSGGGRARRVLGTNFHPAQHGVWFIDGRSYNVLINPRKSQPLSDGQEKFLARAMYELHGIDDPNEPDQMIIEVAAPPNEKERRLRVHNLTEKSAMSLEDFEEAMRRFFEALTLAGLAYPAKPAESFRDLFRESKL